MKQLKDLRKNSSFSQLQGKNRRRRFGRTMGKSGNERFSLLAFCFDDLGIGQGGSLNATSTERIVSTPAPGLYGAAGTDTVWFGGRDDSLHH